MALTPDLPLVGRDDLLARLIAAIDAAAGGHAQAVVLCGEPGAGKSRLAQEAAAVAAARGFRVLSSTGSPLQRDLHYGVLIDVLRPLVRRGPSGARTALVEGLSGLTPLFDDLEVPTGEALGDSRLERTRLFESVRRLLERAARQQPLLIEVDDSHWADSASLAALAYALAGTQASRLCLLAARRSGETDPADIGFVDALRRVRHTTELEVGSLDQPGIRDMAARLLGGEPPQALVELLADRSGGLPLFVRGIVSQLVASRRLTRVGGHWVLDSMDRVELPSEVSELVRARLESLSADQRALVDLVAVAGGAIAHSLLTSASATDPLPALQRLLDSGMIVEDLAGSGVAYRLMHPLVTEVAAGLLHEVARRRLHARLAAAVRRDDPTQLGLLAHHMTGAGDQVDANEALEVLRAALEQALEARAGAAAARHADAALRLARQLGRVEEVPTLLEQRAGALDLAGEGSSALAAWTAAGNAWQAAGATRQWGRALVQLSIAEWDRGLFSEAVEHVEDATRALRAWPTAEEYLWALETWAGYLHRLSSPRLPDAVTTLEKAARETGSPIARLEADLGRAGIGIAGRDLAAARGHAQRAVAGAEASGSALLLERSLRALASLELEWGHHDEAVRLTERGVEAARRAGVPTLEVVPRALRLNTALYTGEWDVVEHGARELLELAYRIGSARGMGFALVIQGTLSVYRGDLTTAIANRDEIRAVYGGGRQDDRHLFSTVEIMDALIDLAEGRPGEAAESLEHNLKSFQLNRVVAAQAAAEARLATGEPERALAQAATLAAAPSYGPWAQATSQWIRGLAALTRGGDTAPALLRAAAEQLDDLGLSFPAAAAWLDWARVPPDEHSAIEVLTERLTFLDGIGARPLADRARAQLREHGVRPARAAAEGTGPLSARELEVASLVAEGLGNAEIAQRLFISPRTVTTHLHHVYERLGISSRTALARWFMEQSPRTDARSLARNT